MRGSQTQMTTYTLLLHRDGRHDGKKRYLVPHVPANLDRRCHWMVPTSARLEHTHVWGPGESLWGGVHHRLRRKNMCNALLNVFQEEKETLMDYMSRLAFSISVCVDFVVLIASSQASFTVCNYSTRLATSPWIERYLVSRASQRFSRSHSIAMV